MQSVSKLLLSLLAVLVIVPLLAFALLYVSQDRLIFPAPQLSVAGAADETFDDVLIATEDGETLFALYHPARPGEAQILVLHGNADAAVLQKSKGAALAQAGFGVLLLEYRGYPGSTGQPSETGFYLDAEAGFDFLMAKSDGAIAAYAHSLGTGVAVELATRREISALVLEAPFDSLVAVAQRNFPWVPVAWLLRHEFRSVEKIGGIEAPILIIHGDADGVVPMSHGRRLHANAKENAEFITLHGAGHNDLMQHGSVSLAVSFLSQKLAF